MVPPIERIDLIDFSQNPPALVCTFFWSEVTGVTCSSQEHLDFLAIQGLAIPPCGDLVFPGQGRIFFDNLPVHFSGSFLRATSPRIG